MAARSAGGRQGEIESLRTDWRQITPGQLARLAGPRFPPGTVAQVEGSMAGFWAVAGAAMGPEDWAAIAGLPEAGLLAAAEAGLVLSRTVVVPDLGVQPLKVLAGLVDAYGLVVTGRLRLGGGDRRRIEARLRFTGGRLITAGQWGGAKLAVKVKALHGTALGEGWGLAGHPRLDVELTSKGSFGAWS
ncbi:MAG: hypothetical protein LBU05_01025 [Bifidobacteriaceae bacterium]|jgi:hypothetical protein|nr:hypothetical protein [Bifidobacteriaceae bacterium]